MRFIDSPVAHAACVELCGVERRLSLAAQHAHLLHAFDGDVVKVSAALGVGIERIPAGSHCGKDANVLLGCARIEDEHGLTAGIERLEECEV